MTGAQVRSIRERLGLTQAAFADLIGVARNSVARWEMGILGMREPVDRLIRRIAKEHGAATKPTRREDKAVKPKRKRRKGGP